MLPDLSIRTAASARRTNAALASCLRLGLPAYAALGRHATRVLAAGLIAIALARAGGLAAELAPAAVRIQLKLTDGRIRVDLEQSGFDALAPDFRAACVRTTPELALRQALLVLDASLEAKGLARQVAAGAAWADEAKTHPTEAVDRVTAPWSAAVEAFDALARARADSNGNLLTAQAFPALFSSGFDAAALGISDTPLKIVPRDLAAATADGDSDAVFELTGLVKAGIVRATLIPPFTKDEWQRFRVTIASNAAMFPQPERLAQALRDELQALTGGFWWNQDVRPIVEDYLAQSGFPTGAGASASDVSVRAVIDAYAKTISLHGAPSLEKIKFTLTGIAGDPAQQRLALIGLYHLLPTPVFTQVLRNPSAWLVRGEPDVRLFSLSSDQTQGRNSGAKVFLNSETLPLAAPRLAASGMVLQSTLKSSDDTRQLLIQAVSPDAPEAKPVAAPATKNHVLRLQVSAKPGRPHDVDVSYRQTRVTGDDALAASAGNHTTNVGAFSYSRDYVAFPALGRRLLLTAGADSDNNPDRQLAGQPATEKRERGNVSALLEVWRNDHGRWLNATATAGYVRSKTAATAGTLEQFGAVNGTLGLDFRHGPPLGGIPYTTAELTAAVGSPDTHRGTYTWTRAKAAHRGFLVGFVEFETRAQGWVASGTTPLAERPSLGGEDSVRGFRRDAAVGRSLWSLQNELWLPLRHLSLHLPDGLARFVRRQVHVAAFADVGGVDAPGESLSTVRCGAGAGVRVTHQFVTARLDWGRALNATTRVAGGSFVYFTLSVQPTF